MATMREDVKARAVAAVRADEIVGRGTCSVIDECYEDAELVALFERHEATTVRAAVAAARRAHKVWHAHADEIAATAW